MAHYHIEFDFETSEEEEGFLQLREKIDGQSPLEQLTEVAKSALQDDLSESVECDRE